MEKLKKLIWIGASKKELQKMPAEVQDEMGYALHLVQAGMFPESAKPLKGISGVYEIKCDFDSSTYRTVYALKLGDYIYVLHVFQKKSTSGIKTPKHEIDLVKQRLLAAKEIARGIK
ncbi:MAG: type II toxin-antitoxin system RelE/ParE family toxin [Gammaproteobacteria bacterium]|nr:type II toxin-antitoxin system RelE/ParE family toxin [Gammaproteobacteria bacterium]